MKKRFLLFGLLLCLSSKAYSLTRGDAETEVRRLVKDTATSSTLQRYSASVIDSFLNQSQREVVTATWCLQTSYSISLVANTTYYSLPSDLIAVKQIRLYDTSNKARNLAETSYKALRENNPDFERQSGAPMQYALRQSTTSSTIETVFLPIAVTSSQLGTIIVDYYKQATDMSSDSTTLLDGLLFLIPYHEAVVYQTVAKIKTIEGDTAGVSLYLQLYNAAIQAMSSRLGERPNLNPGFSAATAGSSTSR